MLLPRKQIDELRSVATTLDFLAREVERDAANLYAPSWLSELRVCADRMQGVADAIEPSPGCPRCGADIGCRCEAA